MPRTIPAAPPAGNGNTAPALPPPPTPTSPGLDVRDAAYHMGQDFPGGVAALAQRMGSNYWTLLHKLDPACTTHHLSLVESVKAQKLSGDARILHAMAADLGYVAISLQLGAGRSTLEDVMHLAEEFGDVCRSVNMAVSDGKVTLNEMRDCERQACELISALNAVLANVRSQMPKAPGVALR